MGIEGQRRAAGLLRLVEHQPAPIGEAELRQVFGRQQAQLARRLALAQLLGAVGLGAQGVGAVGIGRGVVGIEADGAAVGLERLPHPAELAQHFAKVVVKIGIVGGALGGAAQQVHRHVGPPRLPGHQAKKVQRLAVAGIAPQHLAIEALGLRQASLAMMGHPLAEEIGNRRLAGRL